MLHCAQRRSSPAQLRRGQAACGTLRDAAQESGCCLDALRQPIWSPTTAKLALRVCGCGRGSRGREWESCQYAAAGAAGTTPRRGK